MSIIEDGNSGVTAEVNEENQLVTRAINESELEHASAKLGTAFSWDSTDLNIDIGDTLLLVKNVGDVLLVLDRLVINGSNVAQVYELNLGSDNTTLAGTIVTPVNLNRVFSTKTADADAMSDETAVADGDTFDRIKIAVDGHHIHDLTGVILGKNHYIQINQEVEATTGSVILYGHFENPS